MKRMKKEVVSANGFDIGPGAAANSRRARTASRTSSASMNRPAGPAAPALLHAADVSTAVYSPCGQFVATASSDGKARVWSASTGALVTPPLVHGAPVLTVAFDPSGTRLVTASLDGTARRWDAQTGAALAP